MIAAASGNRLAEQIYSMLRDIEEDARLKAQFTLNRTTQDFKEHAAIVEAITGAV